MHLIFHCKKGLQEGIGKLSEDRKRVGFLQRGGKEDGNGAKQKQQVSKSEFLTPYLFFLHFSNCALIIMVGFEGFAIRLFLELFWKVCRRTESGDPHSKRIRHVALQMYLVNHADAT
jgi:hypothetical protein